VSDQYSQEVSLPATMLGTAYPTEYATAMFPNEAMAHAAAGALNELGFQEGDLVVASGQQLLDTERQIRDQRRLADRVVSLFPGEEQQIVAEYTALAEQGHAVIAVHVAEADTTLRSQVATTLRNHGGIERHYFGKHVIVDL
jgi:hypothetical protein